MSRIDHFFRRLLLTKFFTKGWGQPDNLKRLFEFRKVLSDRNLCQHLVPTDYPIIIDKEEEQDECRIISGHFRSPFTEQLPGIMPQEVETAHFQMLLPKKWKGHLKPVCVHLAGTGDHNFWRRRMMIARPLMKEANIASVILENPFYGVRKPKSQFRSSLNNVSDLFVMGGALVLESLALFHWLENQGFGPLGITGISMGGHMASVAATNWARPLSVVPCLSWTTASVIFTQMASLAASNWHKPLSLIPCLSWSTASTVFTKGVLSGAIPWQFLQKEYRENDVYGTELVKMIHSPEKSGRTKTEAFLLGQQFNEYLHNLDNLPKSSHGVESEKVDPLLYRPPSPNNPVVAGPISTVSASRNPTANSAVNPDASCDATSHYSTLASKAGAPSSNHHKTFSSSATSSQPSGTNTSRPKLMSRWNIRNRLLNSFQGSNNDLSEEVLDFMRGVMDECTHLGNFSVPVDPNLIIIVSAKNDAYIPHAQVMSLEDLWPGAEVRYINRGHIGAFLLNHHIFRDAIKDSFERQIDRYYSRTSLERQV